MPSIVDLSPRRPASTTQAVATMEESKPPPNLPNKETVSDKVVKAMASPRSGHLNTWATWCYFKMHGGRWFPSWEDCHGETHVSKLVVADPPVLTPEQVKTFGKLRKTIDREGHEEAIKEYDDSNKLYDGTKGKYNPAAVAARIDPRVLDSIIKVEEVLIGLDAPLVLRAYLLFLYPQWGKYVPERPMNWKEDPLKVFLNTPAARIYLLGNMRGKYIDRNARGLIGNLVAEVNRGIK